MKRAPRPFWCARCRVTFATLGEATACPCGARMGVERGSYVLTPRFLRGLRASTCRCTARIAWYAAPTGGNVPLEVGSARELECPACRRKGCARCGHEGHLLAVPTHYVSCPRAKEYRRVRRQRRPQR